MASVKVALKSFPLKTKEKETSVTEEGVRGDRPAAGGHGTPLPGRQEGSQLGRGPIYRGPLGVAYARGWSEGVLASGEIVTPTRPLSVAKARLTPGP